MSLNLIFLALLIGTSLGLAQLRGVSPQEKTRIAALTQWSCDGKTLPMDRFNDNYCDCKDACNNGHFYCSNEGHTPLVIPSYAVDDGICDCCDGSDETTCQNTCAEHVPAGQGLNKKKEELEALKPRLEQLRADLAAKDALHVEAKKVAEAKKRELEAIFTEQFEKQKAIDDAAKAIEAEAQDQEEKKDTEEDSVAGSEGEDDDEEEEEEDDLDTFVEDKIEDDADYKVLHKAQTEAKEEATKIRTELNTVENEEKELQKLIGSYFGPENEYFVLSQKCFSLKTHEYQYEFCPYKNVAQKALTGHSSTDMGKYQNWEENNTAQKFDHGARCWNGPERSTVVTFVCGVPEELLSVEEPSKCAYAMTFRTPAACRASDLPSHVHDEL